jgi:hypothetical protein
MSLRSLVVLSGGALLFLAPMELLACPVCFDTTAENRFAFMQTAAVLTLLPLGMVAGLGGWLRKRAKGSTEEEFDGAGLDGEGAPGGEGRTETEDRG